MIRKIERDFCQKEREAGAGTQRSHRRLVATEGRVPDRMLLSTPRREDSRSRQDERVEHDIEGAKLE